MPAGYVAALTDLLLPRSCIGCGSNGVLLCPACRSAKGPVRQHWPTPPPPDFPDCWVAGDYDGALRAAVLAVKERRRRDLVGTLAELLLDPVVQAVARCATDRVPLLVPVPSSRRAAAERGGDHVLRIGRRLRALDGPEPVAQLAHVLIASGTAPDAVELDAQARRVARDGAFALRPGAARLLAGRSVILIDDIVTSGWTLATCAGLVGRAGAAEISSAVIGATARHSRS